MLFFRPLPLLCSVLPAVYVVAKGGMTLIVKLVWTVSYKKPHKQSQISFLKNEGHFHLGSEFCRFFPV